MNKEWVMAMVVERRRCWYKDLNVPRSGEVVTKIEQAQNKGGGGDVQILVFLNDP